LIKTDTRKLESRYKGLIHFIEREAIPTAQKYVLSQVRELTAKGLDADGVPFHDYSPAYEARKNRRGTVTRVTRESRLRGRNRNKFVERTTSSLKNLSDTGEMMNGLYRDDNKIVLRHARDQQIAHGQMYHPKWSYHHLFLGIGEKTNKKLELLLAQ
jgi:hypothetical protein